MCIDVEAIYDPLIEFLNVIMNNILDYINVEMY
jgi:hypothetical protein